MNREFNRLLHSHVPTLPLHESGNIIQGNSLRTDWVEFCPANKGEEVYVVGNPPFGGVNSRSEEQSEDMEIVFKGFKTFKSLDYVTSWFWLGAQYIKKTGAELALVATNSICQGVQVAPLWEPIFDLGLEIDFAYQPFLWKNNARDRASVFVIIIGISTKKSLKNKYIYKEIDKNWHQQSVNNVGPYLINANNLIITSRSKPLSKNTPSMLYGNKPVDGGYLLFTEEDKVQLINKNNNIKKWFRPILGASEFINGGIRWCLWLADEPLDNLKKIPEIYVVLKKVEEFRIKSPKSDTNSLAKIPHLFAENRQPITGSYILVPSVSSERRHYIPIGFLDHKIVTTNANFMIPHSSLYDFAILTSIIHNDWMRIVAGRLKQDYRYSASIVYNTFPWPQNIGLQRRYIIEELAKDIIRARAQYPDKTLADLYDPDTMPLDLLEAHETLDRAVEKLYRDAPFRDSTERVEYLFKLYEKLIIEEKK